MSCREPVTGRPQGQLLLDYLTDTVLSAKPALTGIPKISPDSRHIATIDHHDDGVTLVIQKITRMLYVLCLIFSNVLPLLCLC